MKKKQQIMTLYCVNIKTIISKRGKKKRTKLNLLFLLWTPFQEPTVIQKIRSLFKEKVSKLDLQKYDINTRVSSLIYRLQKPQNNRLRFPKIMI